MVRIIRAFRESIFKIEGNVIDMDGLYSHYYDNAQAVIDNDPQEAIKKLFELIAAAPNVVIFSYDTLMIMLIEMSGRKGYKTRLNNLLRAMRVLECATGKSITLVRFGVKLKNDPQDMALADSPCSD
ncbi:MAG: hypothetical protein QXY52_05420 [Conexivisphaerales archaeon]